MAFLTNFTGNLTAQIDQQRIAQIRTGNFNNAPLHVRNQLQQRPFFHYNPPRSHQLFQNVLVTETLPPHLENDPTFLPPRPIEGILGFGIDLNGSGNFERKSDGILAFDFNRDGMLDKDEITQSRDILKSFSQPHYFPGGDTQEERWNSEGIMRLRAQIDKNNDGRLDRQELKESNAMLWVDHNGDGKPGTEVFASETYRADSFSTENNPFRELEFVDVRQGQAQSRGKSFFPPQPPFNPYFNMLNSLMYMLMGMGRRF